MMQPGATGAKLMIVDDDEDICDITKIIFEAEGYRVTTASNGEEAWASLQEDGRPSLILLDLMMPHVDGERFVEMLRRTPLADVPIVVMSGHAGAEEAAKRLAVSGYLTKPVDLDELLGTVRRLLVREAAGQEPAPLETR